MDRMLATARRMGKQMELLGRCLTIATIAAATGGCGKFEPPSLPKGPLAVTVALPVERVVSDYQEFTGRTDAVQYVEVRSRVAGYIVEIPFVSGADVKKGDLLFQIDPRPYQAQLDLADAQLDMGKATLQLKTVELARAQRIAQTPGAISQQDIDKAVAEKAEAEAQVESAKANIETAKLNLEFAHITTPIDGMVSRNLLTIGNVVTPDNTLLTTVVSQDPIYGYFNVDERTMLTIRELVRSGKLPNARIDAIPVDIGLATDKGFPHRGHIDFVNNQLDPSTGTITIRGVFPNPVAGPHLPRLFSPGLFIRVRVPIGPPHPALLISERAIMSDQGSKYVFVVNEKKIVEYRAIKAGPQQGDLRTIVSGIKAGEHVMVEGMQRVRAGAEVNPKLVPMPDQETVESPMKDDPDNPPMQWPKDDGKNAKTAEVKAVEEKKSEETKKPAESKPVEAKPAEAKPTEPTPKEAKEEAKTKS